MTSQIVDKIPFFPTIDITFGKCSIEDLDAVWLTFTIDEFADFSQRMLSAETIAILLFDSTKNIAALAAMLKFQTQ